MRGTLKVAGVIAAVLGALGVYAAVATLFMDPGLALVAAVSHSPLTTGLLLAGMVGGPAKARPYSVLQAMSSPASSQEPQSNRWVLFDTDTITTAVTTVLNFFNTPRGNPNLSNLGGNGQLGAGQYFEVFYLGFDILSGVSFNAAAAAAGAYQDIAQIMMQTAPTFLVEYNGKNYGQFPLSFTQSSGGPQGVIATGTAANTLQAAINGGTGWNWGGGLILQPSTQFNISVRFNGAPTITTGPLLARFWMEGVLSRNVV